jgi:excinuclease UvrABC nuclease subunit
MKALTFNIITLEWRKFDGNITHSSSGLECDLSKIPDCTGLYQIYGASSYGLDSLLYIGKSKNLKSRLTEHLFKDTMISRQQNLSIRYACVCSKEYPEIDKTLEAVETINIAIHKPCLNSQSVSKPYNKSLYLVQNHGERGILNLQITNSYWV